MAVTCVLSAESADDDYTLAPHVEVRDPVAQGSGAPPRGLRSASNVAAVLAAACAAVLSAR